MTLHIYSPTADFASSYGRLAQEIAGGLSQLGYMTHLIARDSAGGRFVPAVGGFLLGYPTNYGAYGALANMGPRVAVTTFESTRIPGEWVPVLNACGAVVVPSQWNVAVFQACGVTAPIHVVPHGISEAFKQPVRRHKENGPFTFIAFADRGWRKGWYQAVMAFEKAFGRDMNYRLILKARSFPIRITNPNIELITGDMSDAELVALYHRCHVMIAANCGEGFGFLPREFAATGGVALATDFGGTADAIQHWGVPLPYSMADAWPEHEDWSGGRMGQWADPDIDGIADLLRHVADHYDAYADFGIRAAGYIMANYRWSLYAKRLAGLWQQARERYDGSNNNRNQPASAAVGG